MKQFYPFWAELFNHFVFNPNQKAVIVCCTKESAKKYEEVVTEMLSKYKHLLPKDFKPIYEIKVVTEQQGLNLDTVYYDDLGEPVDRRWFEKISQK